MGRGVHGALVPRRRPRTKAIRPGERAAPPRRPLSPSLYRGPFTSEDPSRPATRRDRTARWRTISGGGGTSFAEGLCPQSPNPRFGYVSVGSLFTRARPHMQVATRGTRAWWRMYLSTCARLVNPVRAPRGRDGPAAARRAAARARGRRTSAPRDGRTEDFFGKLAPGLTRLVMLSTIRWCRAGAGGARTCRATSLDLAKSSTHRTFLVPHTSKRKTENGRSSARPPRPAPR